MKFLPDKRYQKSNQNEPENQKNTPKKGTRSGWSVFSFDFDKEEFSEIQIIQQLMVYKDIRTTMIYTQLSSKNATRIENLLDRLNLKPEIKKNEKKVE